MMVGTGELAQCLGISATSVAQRADRLTTLSIYHLKNPATSSLAIKGPKLDKRAPVRDKPEARRRSKEPSLLAQELATTILEI